MTAGTQDFEIVSGDALSAIKRLQDGSVQLLLTSPPYNIGKIYEKEGFDDIGAYAKWMEKFLKVAVKKLAQNGSICWQVGNYVDRGSVTPLDYIFYPIFSKLGLVLRNRIVWTFNFGLHAKQRLSGRYEVMLWLTKSDEYKFNLDAIRVPQIYPGKRHSAKKGKSGPSGNPLGKNPSDFWTFDGDLFFRTDLVWKIPNVKWNHPEYDEHPCQFPAELAERCILAFSDSGDLVLDPFAGTGTTAIVAKALGRRGLGIELHPEYAELARRRHVEFEKGERAKRPSGVAVRQPTSNEKVSRIPVEWMQDAAE